MADRSSLDHRTRCSGCGASAQRHILRLSRWTLTGRWRLTDRYCWACSVQLLRLRDAVQWAERQ